MSIRFLFPLEHSKFFSKVRIMWQKSLIFERIAYLETGARLLTRLVGARSFGATGFALRSFGTGPFFFSRRFDAKLFS